MTMAAGLEAYPTEQSSGAGRPVSKRWVALFVALAAGWGTLFGYSVTFLSEDLPFRPAAAAPPEVPAFGFPPLPQTIAVAAATPVPEVQVPRVVEAPAPVVAAVSAPAAAPVPAPPPHVERAEYVGTWGPTEAACGKRSRRRGYIPATITPERASAGRTICSFHDGRRVGNAWTMAADCAERGRRWSSQVRLVVDGDRLTWTSGKGTASYVRCGKRAG